MPKVQEFHLLATLYADIDAHLLQGQLLAAGIDAKIKEIKQQPSPSSQLPDTFGVYVPKDKMAGALKIHSQFSPYKNTDAKYHAAIKIFSYAVGAAVLIFMGYIIYTTMQYISSGLSK